MPALKANHASTQSQTLEQLYLPLAGAGHRQGAPTHPKHPEICIPAEMLYCTCCHEVGVKGGEGDGVHHRLVPVNQPAVGLHLGTVSH